MEPKIPAALSLLIGADLRIREAGDGWGALGLAATRLAGARVQEVFPFGRVQLAVLDVLAAGAPAEGVLIPLEEGDGGRVLCASLSPIPSGSQRPWKVLLVAHELEGRLVIDEATLRIVEANEAAARMFGVRLEDLIGHPVGDWEAFLQPRPGESVWSLLSRKTSLYLGKAVYALQSGRKVRAEGSLLLLDS